MLLPHVRLNNNNLKSSIDHVTTHAHIVNLWSNLILNVFEDLVVDLIELHS
jgi:hypothetical protein